MTELNDEALLERFRASTLTREQWNHRAHVRVAFLYLVRSAYPDALDRVRRGIMALNEALGTAHTPSGYHETVTCAWMRLVAGAFDGAKPPDDSGAFLDAHPDIARKETLLAHYSSDLLATREARTSYVEPDLKPLPVVQSKG